MEKPYSKFTEDWKDIMLDLGRNGKSNKDIFTSLKIGHSTHFNLLRRSEEYKQVYNQYLELHEAYWLDKAKQALEQDLDFNTQDFFLLMGNKHRHKWNNKCKK
jgi:hypothetical protein